MPFLEVLQETLKEARIKGKTYNYYKKGTGLGTKFSPSKKEKDSVVRVAVELNKKEGAKYHKLAETFEEINQKKKELQSQEKEYTARAREIVPEIFDKADEAYARAIRTADLVLQISKVAEVRNFDVDGLLVKIAQMAPEIADQLDSLKEKYTNVTRREPTISVLRPESVQNEDLKGIWQKTKEVGKDIWKSFTDWLRSYDQRLSVISAELKTAMQTGID